MPNISVLTKPFLQSSVFGIPLHSLKNATVLLQTLTAMSLVPHIKCGFSFDRKQFFRDLITEPFGNFSPLQELLAMHYQYDSAQKWNTP